MVPPDTPPAELAPGAGRAVEGREPLRAQGAHPAEVPRDVQRIAVRQQRRPRRPPRRAAEQRPRGAVPGGEAAREHRVAVGLQGAREGAARDEGRRGRRRGP